MARRSRLNKKSRKTRIVQLNITSLMDMFTIILLFLLQTFSAEGQAFTTSKTFKLPESTATAPLAPRLMIQITEQDIIVEGKAVAKVSDLNQKVSATNADLIIKPLEDALTEIAKQSVYIATRNTEMELSRTVIIMGDKRIPFSVLEQIMFTAGKVGYNNLSLAVISGANISDD